MMFLYFRAPAYGRFSVLHRLIALIAALSVVAGTTADDEAELRGSTLYVQPDYAEVMLPPAWFGEKDSVAVTPSCGHHTHGALPRRLAVNHPMLDSARNATGEWDRE